MIHKLGFLFASPACETSELQDTLSEFGCGQFEVSLWIAIFFESKAETAKRRTTIQRHLSNAMSVPHSVFALSP